MNLKTIKSLVLLGIVAAFMMSCNNEHPGFKKAENGIYYQIVSQVDSTSHIKIDSGKFWNLTMSYGTLDSLLFDAAQNNINSVVTVGIFERTARRAMLR